MGRVNRKNRIAEIHDHLLDHCIAAESGKIVDDALDTVAKKNAESFDMFASDVDMELRIGVTIVNKEAVEARVIGKKS